MQEPRDLDVEVALIYFKSKVHVLSGACKRKRLVGKS